MDTPRRARPGAPVLFAAIVAALALGSAAPRDAAAQSADWPTRTLTVIVPPGAGSASDIMARVVMEQVGRQLGQTVVVENRPGAGGTIGANAVAKAPADGHTILAFGALGTAHALYPKLPYDTFKDFAAVIPFGRQPLVIVASPAKYKTLQDLVAAGRTRPEGLNFSSAGVGSASHFGAERLRVAGGFKAQHIPFKGAAEAVTDVIAGRSDFSVQLFTTSLPQIRDRQLVALAVGAEARSAVLPDVPTLVEAGLPAEAVYPFYSGLFVPAGTQRAIVDRLHRETAAALQVPAVKERLATLGVEPMAMTVDEFDRFFRQDAEAAVSLVKAAGIKPAF
ncbi:tripartite tricarboxylate transporter substrate-binding protein [Rhodoplanes sp. TEM]|uniref:Tripartite tricarboxylate transporter substrate-binding protein n=1 Tax=Rhodoplanes tepidamans TaxID=200616 RepID=A0ABT5J7R8_RHOTP|nr:MULTISPECIES: tripartite tricarboxylate transporter substrate-binding protein [Rhodoplanes]MDC7785682.1 tripartite tricarboxylate transporter substrate-binding protein [Rhodoplanes tepidamans]MDC7983323.1 tripartite tricarboxylate transporter substrate-binding protein [Rhodoplanes sp. TEM]MDQ0354750.1 tripartite-type tricarboxylate transporter receptor subunit TctC [Rhodoplanes tepidamans]